MDAHTWEGSELAESLTSVGNILTVNAGEIAAGKYSVQIQALVKIRACKGDSLGTGSDHFY
jgi:hypothetical protein